MVSKRLSHETGHRRKFLAVVDETPECERAVAYASRRAKTTGGVLVLLYVIESADFQQFMGVEKIMRAEAKARADMALARHVTHMRETYGSEPEVVIREGTLVEQIHKLIDEDQDIAILILAASGAKEGPGPLVQSIAGRAGAFPIPVTIIPHSLTDADIISIA